MQGHRADQVIVLETGMKSAEQLDENRDRRAWLSRFGSAYNSLGQTNKAIEYYERALNISREIGNREDESADLNSLGSAYFHLDDVERAIGNFEQAFRT